MTFELRREVPRSLGSSKVIYAVKKTEQSGRRPWNEARVDIVLKVSDL